MIEMPNDFRGFLDPYPTTPLDKSETMFLLQMMMASKTGGIPAEVREKVLEDFLVAIASKRLAAYGIEYDMPLLLFLLLRAGNPGHAVMVAYTIALMNAEQKKVTTLDDAVMRYFPMGLPVMEGPVWGELWDSQKVPGDCKEPVGSDNLIDIAPWPKPVLAEAN
jgi:hypothetical protein